MLLNWLYKNKNWIGLVIFACLFLLFLPQIRNITVDSIVGFMPSSIVPAVLVFAMIYAVKAIVMFPPLKVLYIAAGIVFPAAWGVVITYLCLTISLTVGYSAGKWLGEEKLRQMISRNKKLAHLLDESNLDSLPALCFVARVLPFPRDLFSMLCGSLNVPYGKYLVASLLGLSTFMLPFVLSFAAISSPVSVGFIIPLIVCAAVLVITIILYICQRKFLFSFLPRKFQLKPLKKAKSLVLLCLATFFMLGLFPFMGNVYVSADTRDAFSMERFYGKYASPERVMLLECPRDAFFHRVNLISNAEEEILLSSFAFREGISGDIIVGALLSAADRGVSVSLMNNAVGGFIPASYRNALSAHENIDVYLFNRLNFLQPHYINPALHDKYMVTDGTFMIFGGRNIGDRDFAAYGYTGRISYDREVLVFNTEPEFQGSIADIMAYFNLKINSERASLQNRARVRNNSEAQKNHFIGLYMSYRESIDSVDFDFDFYYNTILANRITLITNPIKSIRKDSIVAYNLMMMTKNSHVIIAQSPYVALTNRNIEIFAEAVRGRDFTLLTNSLASTPNLPSFSSYHVSRRNIINTGIIIYEYQCTQTSIHAKTYLFNGRLTAIGSFNLNERSIRSDTESMLIIDSEEFHGIVLEAINNQIAQSLRVNADGSYVLNDIVAPGYVPRSKRVVFTIVGNIVRPIRFMV